MYQHGGGRIARTVRPEPTSFPHPALRAPPTFYRGSCRRSVANRRSGATNPIVFQACRLAAALPWRAGALTGLRGRISRLILAGEGTRPPSAETSFADRLPEKSLCVSTPPRGARRRAASRKKSRHAASGGPTSNKAEFGTRSTGHECCTPKAACGPPRQASDPPSQNTHHPCKPWYSGSRPDFPLIAPIRMRLSSRARWKPKASVRSPASART